VSRKAIGWFILLVVPIALVTGFSFTLTMMYDCYSPLYQVLIASIILTFAIAFFMFCGWMLIHPNAGFKARKPTGIMILLLGICGIIYTTCQLITNWNHWAFMFSVPQIVITIIILIGGIFLIKSAPPK